MKKNIVLTMINALVIGIPILLILGLEGYLIAILLQAALILLLFWNVVGDLLLVHVLFRGKTIPLRAEMKPAIDQYMDYLVRNNIIEPNMSRTVLWSDSKTPYFVPISSRTFVVSIALQDSLVKEGTKLLISKISNSAYEQNVIYTRKCLLLTAVSYAMVLRFLELWAVLFAFGTKLILGLAIAIATGALFGSWENIVNAFSWGNLFGKIVLKLNDWVNYIQDRVVEIFVREVVFGHINMTIQ